MPEFYIQGKGEGEGRTTEVGQLTTVWVSITPARPFMEAHSLSYAPPKSIVLPKPILKPTATQSQRVFDAAKDLATASRWGILGLLFHSEPAGDPNEDQLFIGSILHNKIRTLF
ncbi:hypothetical protein [Proteus myxofaciens]|uniref:Uncharacterized protein n=1 Tax=Proteus myxofaciens ATCC 19692 TaxID=1354337 RepID=A0A198G5W8_9GAMM|nr:hypothetical protein [Proteus myxofaciens]OAT32508.1 hypothetical protein M983_1306 [Proteus myxofaciens ATCC 19692]